jgi:hypothetical protein
MEAVGLEGDRWNEPYLALPAQAGLTELAMLEDEEVDDRGLVFRRPRWRNRAGRF